MNSCTVVHPIAPLYDEESKVLILGSFPSVVSRAEGFYYANRTNRFWPVMEQVFEESINSREDFCHRHHIALWDVVYSCTIEGSSDSSIHDVIPNDIEGLLSKTSIQHILTTGKTAAGLFHRYLPQLSNPVELPSTSAENA